MPVHYWWIPCSHVLACDISIKLRSANKAARWSGEMADWPQVQLGMHDEIFHFEMFKNFVEILKHFKTPSLKYFTKFLIFIIKWLKTFLNMIKVYEIIKYIMLFMHNNRYLPLTGLLTLLQRTIQPVPIVHREIFWNIWEIFHAKKFMKFYITRYSKAIDKDAAPSFRFYQDQGWKVSKHVLASRRIFNVLVLRKMSNLTPVRCVGLISVPAQPSRKNEVQYFSCQWRAHCLM